jgi:hypothetical protein
MSCEEADYLLDIHLDGELDLGRQVELTRNELRCESRGDKGNKFSPEILRLRNSFCASGGAQALASVGRNCLSVGCSLTDPLTDPFSGYANPLLSL